MKNRSSHNMVKNFAFSLSLIAIVAISGCSLGSVASPEHDQRYLSLMNSMEQFADQTRQSNFEREDQIVRNIYNQMLKGDQTNTLLKNEIEETKKLTAQICDYLDKQAEKVKTFAEHDPVTGELMKPGEQSKTANFLLGANPKSNEGRGNGAATEIRMKLDEFASLCNKQVARIDGERGRSGKDYLESPVPDPEFPQATWEYNTFHGASAAAALVEFSRLKLEVLVIESNMLHFYRTLTIGNWGTEVDLLVLESANSRTVDAGEEFVAVIRLGEIFRASQPIYETTGDVEVKDDGSAIVRWKANPSLEVNENGYGIQPYSIIVKVATADGGYREVPFKGEFYVRQ